MSDAINLSRMRDAAFTAEVEAHSGQNVSTCYQCGNCTAGCPAGFVYDLQASQDYARRTTGPEGHGAGFQVHLDVSVLFYL